MARNTPNVTTLEFTVRSYEIGPDNQLRHGTMMNYLEELTVYASAKAGYPNEWYDQHGFLWLIRKWYIRFENPAQYGDRLVGKTWISDMKRVQSHREYELWHGDQRILRARANWVFVDRNRGRPARLFDTFLQDYGPMQETPIEPIETRLSNPQQPANLYYTSRTHRARHYEIDRAQHVNNAHYIRWLEDHILQDIAAAGLPTNTVQIQTHELEYRAAAQAQDIVVLKSAIAGTEGQRVLWQHDLRLQHTAERVTEGWSIVEMPGTDLSTLLAAPTGNI